MNKDIKLVALDMDGTLLNEQMVVSEENEAAIKQAVKQGVHVVLATGRPMPMVKDIAEQLELPSYLVTVNGGEIWTVGMELLEQHYLETADIEKMWNLAEEVGGFYVWMVSSENIYVNDRPVDFYSEKWLKFGCQSSDAEALERVKETLVAYSDRLEITNSYPDNVEVNPIGINKAKALEKVCAKLGITMDNVMAVGDSLNDEKMIKAAGIGVAVGNAQEEIKEIADVIVESNNDHGVARAIERYVLK